MSEVSRSTGDKIKTVAGWSLFATGMLGTVTVIGALTASDAPITCSLNTYRIVHPDECVADENEVNADIVKLAAGAAVIGLIGGMVVLASREASEGDEGDDGGTRENDILEPPDLPDSGSSPKLDGPHVPEPYKR